jgi:hypothetical protein
MNFSESAITLGRIQTEFDCLYRTKEALARLTQSDRIEQLLRMCRRDGVSFEGFEYLEKTLILNRES